MRIVFTLLPLALGVFAVAWYLHVVAILAEKREPLPAVAGIGLFYLPLWAITIPLFTMTGAAWWIVVPAIIVSTIFSTLLFTSGAIAEFDGKSIIYLLFVNYGLYSGMWLLTNI